MKLLRALLGLPFGIALLFVAVVISCSGAQMYERATEPVSLLTIQNDRFYDASVWIAHDGVKGRRLGEYVTGMTEQTFVLKSSDFTHGDLQLIAVFPDDRRPIVSDEQIAVAGSHFHWHLTEQRGQFLWPQQSE